MVIVFAAISCSKNESERADDVIAVADALTAISLDSSPDGVVVLPKDTPPLLREIFLRYTRTYAPNGKPIHFLAQEKWTVDQIKKARNVLEHLLRDFPGSVYGSDKTAAANSMSDRNATMVLFDTPEELEAAFRNTDLRYVDLSMQDLRANENPAEGDDDYMNHITRDASFEEIWHLVHDNGIKQTQPEMLAEMRRANDSAAARGWRAWPDDEPQEHPNEYVGVLLDNYYDLWAVKPKLYEGRTITPEDLPDGKTHFGRYFANSRDKLRELDAPGYELVQKFFHPYLTYTPELPEYFSGAFSIQFDPELAYTYKSQHLKDVTLLGSNPVDLIGNDRDNIFTGNDGPNVLTGGAGNDILDGREGEDTAVFGGPAADYTLERSQNKIMVTDKVPERDGSDTLINIERIKFSDKTTRIED
jgi:hypothetical protein